MEGFGVPGAFVGVVGSVFGGVEWQWRQAGSGGEWCWRVSSSGGLVSGASEEEQFVDWVVGCAKSMRTEAAGSKVAGPFGSAMCQFSFEAVKWDSQERVFEPTAEHTPVFGLKGIAKYRARQLLKLSPRQTQNSLTVVKWWECRNSCFETDSSSGPSKKRTIEHFGDIREAVEEHIPERRVRRRIAEQIVDTPALPDVEEPVFIACRRGADKRLSSSVAFPRDAGRGLSPGFASRRGTKSCTAGTDSLRNALCVPYDRSRWGTKSCTAGTDSRVSALWTPRDRGKLRGQFVEMPKIEQRTFEQLQVVDVLRLLR